MRDLDQTPYGEFVWWIGKVEDTFDDDSKLGRVRVRIIGYHPTDVEKGQLPLAPVLNGGVARINNDEMVLGFFMDGHNAQQPFVLGVIGGSVTNSVGRFFGSISSLFSSDKVPADTPDTQTAFVPNPCPGNCTENPRGAIKDANGTLDVSTLVQIGVTKGASSPANRNNPAYLKKEAAEAYLAMEAAAKADGISWVINDAYRTYKSQQDERDYWTARGKPKNAATPGYSKHGCGLAVDLGTAIWNRPPYHWLAKNAAKFGFRRTPYAPTGQNESWHWEYTLRTGTDAKDTMKSQTKYAPESLPEGENIYGEPAAKKPKTIGVGP